MDFALAPGFLGGLRELPVVEARTEAASDGLRVLGALVVAEAVVGKAQGFREHPALAVVLGEERLDGLVAVAAGARIFVFQVGEGYERQDRMAQLRDLVLIDAPKPLGVRAP